MRQRDITLDILRVIACLLVVLMHSPMPSANANGPFLAVLSYFTAPCIGLFFMVSGALLLPVREDYVVFLRRRFGKVIGPTLFWTAVYISFKIYKTPESIDISRTVLSIPFSAQGHGVLWFMYTLAGLYLLAPVLSAWLEKASRKDLQTVLALWGVTLCYPILEQWIDINEGNTGILYYFGGYVGYFILGFYLKKYPASFSLPVAACIAALGVVVLFLTKYYGIEVDFYRMFWYLSLFIVAICVAIWKSVVGLAIRVALIPNVIITRIANISFGIYLCHILIMRELLWHMDLISGIGNYLLQTAVVFILTFIMSFAVCELLSQLPFAQWLIGYKHSRK